MPSTQPLLRPAELLPYLLQKGLISPGEALSGRLEIQDVSRRNNNYRVLTDSGKCLLLKQAGEPDLIESLAHEAAVHQRLSTDEAFAALRRFIPAYRLFDSDRCILVTLVEGHWESYRDFQMGRRRFATGNASRFAACLSALHGTDPGPERSDRSDGPFPPWMPWVFTLPLPNAGILETSSSAQIELVRIVQRFEELSTRLRVLGERWQPCAVIHADVKFDNFIRLRAGSGRPAGRIRLSDWELAAFGDPAWDVGSVFSEYLCWWLFSIPITDDLPPAEFMQSVRYPLQGLRPATRAFWNTYVERSHPARAEARVLLLRATEFCAARLIQSAFERLRGATGVTPNIVCLLQLSLNILKDSRTAAAQLLGIPVSP